MPAPMIVPRPEPMVLGFLMLPGFPMSCLTSAIEPLRVANEIAGRRVFDWRLLSLDGAPVASSARVSVAADAAATDGPVPGMLFVLSGADPTPDAASAVLRRLSRHGVTVGAISGGIFPLARAGVLRGKRVSVHWCYRTAFAAEFPDVLCSDELIERDGACLTASGAAAGFDLMLHLVRDHLGAAIATETACWFQHPQVRGPGARQQVPAAQTDALEATMPEPVRDAIAILQAHLDDPIQIAEVAARLRLSQRQLERRFKSVTGQSPSSYYRLLRMRAARQLVRFSARSIPDIAHEVGCSSPSHLSRLYRSVFGRTPQDERRTPPSFMAAAEAEGPIRS
ncbi:GlxA family transcriptional regulator [Nioella sp.]|uniref:GlxA family transcriptional regulator n=2 Tax=Nioella sp. TaxID=1912091 RepID=UPI003517ECE8